MTKRKSSKSTEDQERASWEEINAKYSGDFEKAMQDGWKFNWGAFYRKK